MLEFGNEIIKLKGIDNEKAHAQVKGMLLSDEEIVASFESIKDRVIFTNFRIISIRMQGVSGVKMDFTNIPYKHIQVFSVETAGTIDRDCAIEVCIYNTGVIKFGFTSGVDVLKLSQIMSYYIL